MPLKRKPEYFVHLKNFAKNGQTLVKRYPRESSIHWSMLHKPSAEVSSRVRDQVYREKGRKHNGGMRKQEDRESMMKPRCRIDVEVVREDFLGSARRKLSM